MHLMQKTSYPLSTSHRLQYLRPLAIQSLWKYWHDGYNVEMDLSAIPNTSSRFELNNNTAWGRLGAREIQWGYFGKAKALGKEKLFEAAHTLVNEVINVHAEPLQPDSSRLDEGFLNATVSEPFLRFDVVLGRKRHLIFATKKQLKLLGIAKTCYIDGMFKVVKKPFYQLLSIHGFMRSGDELKQIPLCVCINASSLERRRDITKWKLCILRILCQIVWPMLEITTVKLD